MLLVLRSTPSQILEVRCHKMHIQIRLSRVMSTMIGLMPKLELTRWSILSPISGDQCLKMRTLIQLSLATFIMTGHTCSKKSTHNLILEVQCQRMLIQIQLSQAISTMTGLLLNLMQQLENILSQILEDQCLRMLTLIQHFPATSTTTGLLLRLMLILESILNLTSEDQCQRTPILTPPSPATSTMTGQ